MHAQRTGIDGKCIEVPDGWTYHRGSDNRVVAAPKGYTCQQRSDGRVLAILRGRRAVTLPNSRLKITPQQQ